MVTIRPYVHSPEEGTAEASEQPWTIHVPVQPMPPTDDRRAAELDRDEEKTDEESSRSLDESSGAAG